MIYKTKTLQIKLTPITKRIINLKYNNGYKLNQKETTHYIDTYIMDDIMQYWYTIITGKTTAPADVVYYALYTALDDETFNNLVYKRYVNG